jgi:hypothetical protein
MRKHMRIHRETNPETQGEYSSLIIRHITFVKWLELMSKQVFRSLDSLDAENSERSKHHVFLNFDVKTWHSSFQNPRRINVTYIKSL